jgi:hypothetical protein
MKKIAIVTGGSQGIGAATVEKLSSDGFNVFNLDIAPGNNGHFIQCDMSDMQAVERTITQLGHTYKNIDVLVSNAGRHLSATIEDTTEQMLDDLFALNVKGAYGLIKHALPFMKENGGAIVL